MKRKRERIRLETTTASPLIDRIEATSSLLVNRKQAEVLLNTSYSTLRRMEDDGLLTPIKFRGTEKKYAKVHYRKHQVYALIGEPLPTT